MTAPAFDDTPRAMPRSLAGTLPREITRIPAVTARAVSQGEVPRLQATVTGGYLPATRLAPDVEVEIKYRG